MISRNVLVFFKIVPEGHNHCQLSIVNCQFGEAAKQQFIAPLVLGILYLHIFPFGAILEQLPDGGPFPGEAL